MARKNLLASVTGTADVKVEADARADYTRRGASRSMMMSIDEMAEGARRMAAGEAVVELDTELIDGSFVSDRLEDNAEEFEALLSAIREHGQSTPILVRPHPTAKGRYMVVFGHRRTRAARELGLPVKAIVKQVEDIAHIIAQGQENTARANLTFIEKSLFARKLLHMGQEKAVIRAALSIDETLLSRMLSVADSIPSEVISALGPSRNVGRDRWEELKKAVANPQVAQQAREIVGREEFHSAAPGQFDYLLRELKPKRRKAKKTKPARGTWSAPDKKVAAVFSADGRSFDLKLSAPNAPAFGQFISDKLEELYASFEASQNRDETGD